MIQKEEVEIFLKDFMFKLGFYGIIFRDDRSKNALTLAALEISPKDRINIIKKLGVENYSEGPLPERLYNNADMWVFGITVKKQEVYVKISMGMPNKTTLCISFHLAERPMKYPFEK